MDALDMIKKKAIVKDDRVTLSKKDYDQLIQWAMMLRATV